MQCSTNQSVNTSNPINHPPILLNIDDSVPEFMLPKCKTIEKQLKLKQTTTMKTITITKTGTNNAI